MNFNFNAIDNLGREYQFEVQCEDAEKNRYQLTLKKEQLRDVDKIFLLPELSRAKAGEEGYYIIPRNIGMPGEVQTFFKQREDTEYIYKKMLMAFYGIKKRDLCCIVRFERNYQYVIRTSVVGGVYENTLVIDFKGGDEAPYDDIRLEVIMLRDEDDYNTMAATERNIRLERGEIRTLKEKCMESDAVEYARKYPLIRIRMGWKPAPSSVEHQTIDNEPPMYVACDFAGVRAIADELKKQGVPGAELQLVGWNVRGHDGRYPQIFPVEPALGGEVELRKTIDYVKALGYRISLHTNLIDAYEIASNFNWNDICVDRQGEYRITGQYSGGCAWRLCQKQQLNNMKAMHEPLRDYGLNGVHYVDVISIVIPDVCHSKEHPESSAEGIKDAQKAMKYIRDTFGAFSSEGGMDFTLGQLDFALYLNFGQGRCKKDMTLADAHLPIYEMAYHGIVLYNPGSGTINYPIKTPEEQVELFVRGGKPAFYLWSKFYATGNDGWMGEDDLTCETEEKRIATVKAIKEGCERYAPFADLQTVFIHSYKELENGLRIVTYEDGTQIIADGTNISLLKKDGAGK
jgi:hypothetical protein